MPVYLLIAGTYYADNRCLIAYRAENTRRTLSYRFSGSENDDEIASGPMNIRDMGYEVLGITTDGGTIWSGQSNMYIRTCRDSGV